MTIPVEFEKLGMCFYSGIEDDCEGDPEKFVKIGVRIFLGNPGNGSPAARQKRENGRKVLLYIEDLLSGKYTESELRSLWWQTGGVAYMPGGKMSNFLDLIRKRIKLMLG